MIDLNDRRIEPVAQAILDESYRYGGDPSFPREDAAKYWPGFEARKFLAAFDAAAQPEGK
jgi:hypothetical protein